MIILASLILICGLGAFYKHISFGLGLGDMFGYMVLYVGTFVHLILTVGFRNKGLLAHVFLSFTFSTFTVLIVLNATVWRGREYPWDGSLFYIPCLTEIKIENQDVQKQIRIEMCSMEYYSKFTGKWNGDHLILEKEEQIKIPVELERFIERPIVKVEINSDFVERIEKGRVTKNPYFSKDTLKVGKGYVLSGEVQAIRNSMPIINVSKITVSNNITN